MVGPTAVLPTPKPRHMVEKEIATPVGDYDNPKTPGGMTAQRMQCFKTKRCRFWLESRCTRGDRCTYAHTDVELRIPPDLTKTKICTRWKRGTCDKSAGECAYAHGMEDLRDAATPSTATNTGRTNILGEPLSFGVSPSSNKLRDSAPYSSRSCQTISSTASTRYTSRRDSDSSADGQGVKIAVSGQSNDSGATPNPFMPPAAPLLPAATKPAVVASPVLVENSPIHEATPRSDLGDITPDPDTSMVRASSAAIAQFYPSNGLVASQFSLRRPEEAMASCSRWSQGEDLTTQRMMAHPLHPFYTANRCTEELLLAVLTAPYYD